MSTDFKNDTVQLESWNNYLIVTANKNTQAQIHKGCSWTDGQEAQ